MDTKVSASFFGLRNSSVTSNNCSPRFSKFHIDGTSYQKCYNYASKNRASNQNRFTLVKPLMIWRFTLWRDCVLCIDGFFFLTNRLVFFIVGIFQSWHQYYGVNWISVFQLRQVFKNSWAVCNKWLIKDLLILCILLNRRVYKLWRGSLSRRGWVLSIFCCSQCRRVFKGSGVYCCKGACS